MPNPYRSAAICGLLALALPIAGCDLFDSGDDGLSSEELEELQDRFDCEELDAIDLGDDRDGDLEDGDCTLEEITGGADESNADFFAFRVEEDDTDVEFELESDDFVPYLILFDEDGDGLFQESGTSTSNAVIQESLDEGVYVIAVNSSVTTGGEGSYELRTDGDESSDD